MINFDNHNITSMSYNGHMIRKAYGCDARLIWQRGFGGKYRLTYLDGTERYSDCDGNPSITSADTRQSGYENLVLKTVEIGDCVNTIGKYTFGDHRLNTRSISEITLPDTITSIGDYAFCVCDKAKFNNPLPSGLTYIGERAFYWCKGLTEIEIPNTITSISEGAFQWCDNLTAITIPNSVTTIGLDAFSHCESISSITIPESVVNFDNGAFRNCTSLTSFVIPTGVTKVTCGLLNGCTSLTSVTIPNGVTTISKTGYRQYGGSFEGCTSITSVGVKGSGASIEIPDTVEYIGVRAFGDCTSLTSVTLPNSVQYVGENSTDQNSGIFTNCTSLKTVVLGNNVKSIGAEAFSGCTSLESVTIHTTTPPILQEGGKYVFYGNYPIIVPCQSVDAYKTAWPQYASRIICVPVFQGKWKATYTTGVTSAECDSTSAITKNEIDVTNLVSCEIGNCVTSVSQQAFSGCTSLTSVTIGNSVTTIGYQVFRSCISLASITIPNSVTYIGVTAFYSCRGLTSVTIGNSVTSIDQQAFQSCSSLASFTCLATTPPTLGTGALADTNDCPIYVPAESVNAYKSATNWSSYSSRIQAIP